MTERPAPFPTVYQIRSNDDERLESLCDAFEAVVSQLDQWIDQDRSALLVGAEVAITRGSGPIELIIPLRRQRNVTHDEFMKEWYERHTNIGESVVGVRYRQNHVDADSTGKLSKSTAIAFEEIDGVTESFF